MSARGRTAGQDGASRRADVVWALALSALAQVLLVLTLLGMVLLLLIGVVFMSSAILMRGARWALGRREDSPARHPGPTP